MYDYLQTNMKWEGQFYFNLFMDPNRYVEKGYYAERTAHCVTLEYEEVFSFQYLLI